MAKERIKVQITTCNSLDEADTFLADIAEIDRNLAEIESKMNKKIDNEKAKAEAESAAFIERKKTLSQSIASFATIEKDNLFAKSKSLNLTFGTIGFRQSTKIGQKPKTKVADTLELLAEHSYLDGIRTKQEIAKEAMTNWTDEKLGVVGLVRKVEDTFFLEVEIQELK